MARAPDLEPPPPPVPSPPRPGSAPAAAPRARLLTTVLVPVLVAACYFGWARWLKPASPPALPAAAVDSTAPAAAPAVPPPSQPLVSDAAVGWADANSFDRYQAREQLAEGERYLYGQGVPVDYERARQAFETAATTEGRAAFHLSEMYGNALGVAPDPGASFEWLKRAATLGDAEGQYVLGRFYLDGFRDLVVRDAALARQWVSAAAAQGYGPAQSFLAEQGWLR